MKLSNVCSGTVAPTLFAVCASSQTLACAACGCTLSGDAAMGYSSAPGWRLNLEYSFIDQNQLRHGTHSVSTLQVATINDAGGDQEVEQRTVNRYLNLGISYTPTADWNINLLVPYVLRSHTTYGSTGIEELSPNSISGADSDGLGDTKLIGSYQGFLPTHNLGIQFGVKLPTGRYGGQNTGSGTSVGHRPVFFSSGPSAAEGEALDTSLNPGTGSTDLIIGAYYYRAVSQNFDAFINGQFQAAVTEKLDGHNADFRPGNQGRMSVGLRYEANPLQVPQLQVNIEHKGRDRGALADTDNSAGTAVYLSPGIALNPLPGLQIYGFVQLPLYSRLDGYQLFPRWTASLGVSRAF